MVVKERLSRNNDKRATVLNIRWPGRGGAHDLYFTTSGEPAASKRVSSHPKRVHGNSKGQLHTAHITSDVPLCLQCGAILRQPSAAHERGAADG